MLAMICRFVDKEFSVESMEHSLGLCTSSIEHLSLVSAQLKALFELYKRLRVPESRRAHFFFHGLKSSRIPHLIQTKASYMKYAAPLTQFLMDTDFQEVTLSKMVQ